MSSKLSLGPLSDRHYKYTTQTFDCLVEDIDLIHRENRYHLKHYLSSNQLSVPHSHRKKLYELTESTINHQTSPRILKKILETSKSCTKSKEKNINKIVALKKANKNVLNAMNNFTYNKSFKHKQVLIKVPEDLNLYDKEVLTERSEILQLVEWFEMSLKNGCWDELVLMGKGEKGIGEEIRKNEEVLEIGFSRFVDLIKVHCIEQAGFVVKFFEKYRELWRLKVNSKVNSQEFTIKKLMIEAGNGKNEFVALKNVTEEKISNLELELEKKNKEIFVKDAEIGRLGKLVRLVKEERAVKLMKQMQMYEDMIVKIKKKVKKILSEIDDNTSGLNLEHREIGENMLAQLYLVEKFRDENLNSEALKEAFLESENILDSLDQSILFNNTVEQYTQTELVLMDKETNIGPVYFNEETQTFLIIDEQPQISITQLEEEIIDLRQAGLIPASVEIESWSAGYFTGLDRGKTLAQNESIQVSENDENLSSQFEDFDEDDHLIEETEKRMETEKKEEKNDYRRKKLATKFKQFNFQRREKIVLNKISKSKNIKDFFLRINKETISKRTKMSKKMLMKTINNLYFSLISKIKVGEVPEDLLEYVYSEFENKNSVKKLVKRKILDFLCNLVNYSSCLKAKNFLRFLDLQVAITDTPLNNIKDSLQIYLTGLDSIFKSKAGIMPEFSEYSETHYVPTVRVLEFFKFEFSETFPPQRFSKNLDFIEKNSSFDKKRLNKSGVIELEIVLNHAVNQYEEHCIAVKNTGLMIIKGINCENNPEFIKKSDLVFVAGMLKPGKHFREIEMSNWEVFRCDEVLNGPLKSIFPEEFVEEEEGDSRVEYLRVLEMVEKEKFLEKNRFAEIFEIRGKELGFKVLAHIRRMVEIYCKGN